MRGSSASEAGDSDSRGRKICSHRTVPFEALPPPLLLLPSSSSYLSSFWVGCREKERGGRERGEREGGGEREGESTRAVLIPGSWPTTFGNLKELVIFFFHVSCDNANIGACKNCAVCMCVQF